jgi:hypothetical protein
MKYVTLLVVLLVAWVGCTLALEDGSAARLFEDFKRTYGRNYAPSEEAHRLSCFTENLGLIDKRNAEDPHAHHGVNQFADLCPAEFAKQYLGFRPSNTTRKAALTELTPVKKSCTAIDWRKRGIVTPVKNQGQCGSSWAYAATANMEGQWARIKGQLVSLSEEELIQCTTATGNQGCCGGEMDASFEWVIQNGGIDSESDYPYTSANGTDGTCINSKVGNKAVGPFSFYQDLPADEHAMAAWMCENGTLSIGVCSFTWQTYTGGIVTSCCNMPDHGAMIVGFDETFTPPYWIVKNQWGVTWGEQGYIRIKMFVNECDINSYASSIFV